MDEYPSNSQSNKPGPKKIERIVAGEVVRRKKPMGKKFKDMFFGADVKGIWMHVWTTILIPMAKDMVVDAGEEALRRRVFGDSGYGGGIHRNRNRASSFGYGAPGHMQYTNNARYSQSTPRDSQREEPRNMSDRGRAQHNFDEIILDTRVEAEEVIDQLCELVSDYDVASVKDLYEMLGIKPAYTDAKWGWMDLRGATATRVRGGFLLNLPKPVPID